MRGGDVHTDEAGTESIELQEQEQLLAQGNGVDNNQIVGNGKTGYVVKSGRPDIASIVNLAFSGKEVEKVAVLVCGSSGIGATLREAVAKWVKEGKEVFWHAEEFGW